MSKCKKHSYYYYTPKKHNCQERIRGGEGVLCLTLSIKNPSILKRDFWIFTDYILISASTPAGSERF